GRGVGLEAAALGRVTDREVIAVANAYAEGTIGHCPSGPRLACGRLVRRPERRGAGPEPELRVLSAVGVVLSAVEVVPVRRRFEAEEMAKKTTTVVLRP